VPSDFRLWRQTADCWLRLRLRQKVQSCYTPLTAEFWSCCFQIWLCNPLRHADSGYGNYNVHCNLQPCNNPDLNFWLKLYTRFGRTITVSCWWALTSLAPAWYQGHEYCCLLWLHSGLQTVLAATDLVHIGCRILMIWSSCSIKLQFDMTLTSTICHNCL